MARAVVGRQGEVEEEVWGAIRGIKTKLVECQQA